MSTLKNKPINRHEYLKPLSREHHFGLLLTFKIREGIKRGVEFKRIKRYTDWFWENFMIAHFEFEEKYVFPILGEKHESVVRALSDHRKIKRLFNDSENIEKSISLLEEEVDHHIRFEERVLFNEVQEVAEKEELEGIIRAHNNINMKESYDDPFWEK